MTITTPRPAARKPSRARARRESPVDLEKGIIRTRRRKTGILSTVPISRACAKALEECRRRPTISPLVFLTDEEAPYSLSTFERHFKLAKTLAGIERRFRVHDLRQTFACTLVSEGVPSSDIQKALGHSTARMSERYARSAPDASIARMKAALDRESPAENLAVNSSMNFLTDKGNGAR